MTNKDRRNDAVVDSYDYLGKAASSMDCTGLIPSAPQNSSELESYESIYPFLPHSAKAEEDPRAKDGEDFRTDADA